MYTYICTYIYMYTHTECTISCIYIHTHAYTVHVYVYKTHIYAYMQTIETFGFRRSGGRQPDSGTLATKSRRLRSRGQINANVIGSKTRSLGSFLRQFAWCRRMSSDMEITYPQSGLALKSALHHSARPVMTLLTSELANCAKPRKPETSTAIRRHHLFLAPSPQK